ncbi:carbohydrate sulfotransferase 10 [Lingula anatina]|uniref:Carbohydrate sulfotransferase n=1 Tax=Lingula anatina TaxID=7574 RepID=A0A1S3HZU1_LINAN|nr:carbohydrate sulfotransferase 10 [Lingula anatina]|eukprot:XP_013390614.1 carbohydrate sulfotransferase 10 [Lingula anatina]
MQHLTRRFICILITCMVLVLMYLWDRKFLDLNGLYVPKTKNADRRAKDMDISGILKQKYHWDKVPGEWLETMKRRRQMLFQMCKDQNETIRPGAPVEVKKHPIPDRTFVEDIYQIVLCPMAKAASKTWLKIYFKLNKQMNTSALHNDWISGHLIHVHNLNKYTEFGINTRLNTYLKIMTVRHPMIRLVSVYHEQVAPHGSQFERYVKRFIEKTEGRKIQSVTFEDFLRYAIQTPNMHWDPFIKFCDPCHIDYDLLIYFETLADDAKNTLILLGADDMIKLPPSHRADKMSADDEARKHYDGVDRELLKRVIAMYGIEEKYFGYNLSLFS